MKKKSRILLSLATVALVGGGVAGAVAAQAGGRQAVTTATAEVKALAVSVAATGTVQPAEKVAVYPKVAGAVAAVKVSDGQQVKKGDLLASLDAGSFESQVARAKSQVAGADAQAEAAAAQLASAKALPEDSSKQRAAREAAIASAVAAQNSAGAAQSAAATALKSAQQDADRTEIVAPADGTVTLLPLTMGGADAARVAVGAQVSPAAPVFSILTTSQVNFTGEVDQSDVAGVAVGQAATVTLDAYPGKTFAGKVAEVAPWSVTSKTGGTAYLVKVPLPTEDAAAFRLGMGGDVSISTQTLGDALVVPVRAVRVDGGKHYVFKVEGERVRRVEVETGATTETLVQIRSGLTAREVVATSELSSLSDGAAVSITP